MKILIIGNGFDKAHSINIEFQDFVKSKSFELGMKSYLKFFRDKKYRELIRDNRKLWSSFENFCFLVANDQKIKNRNKFYKNISTSFVNWFKEIWNNPREESITTNKKIGTLFKQKNYHAVFSFNYTLTAKMYGFKSTQAKISDSWRTWTLEKIKKRLINLHYCVNKPHIFIVGSDEEEKINKDYLIEDWNDVDSINHKQHYLDLIIKENSIKEVDFYGFSFGKSDKNIGEFLLKFWSLDRKINIFDINPIQIKENLSSMLKHRKGKVKLIKSINFIKIA